jgi:hypothetical protein
MENSIKSRLARARNYRDNYAGSKSNSEYRARNRAVLELEASLYFQNDIRWK